MEIVGEHVSYWAAAWLEFPFGSVYWDRAELSEDEELFELRFLFVPWCVGVVSGGSMGYVLYLYAASRTASSQYASGRFARWRFALAVFMRV